MELKLQRNLVLQELSILQGVVEHRTTIPILSSILAEAEENRLRIKFRADFARYCQNTRRWV